MTLGIAGDRQVYNAALAVQLCRVWLEAHNTSNATVLLKIEKCNFSLLVQGIMEVYINIQIFLFYFICFRNYLDENQRSNLLTVHCHGKKIMLSYLVL